MRSKAIAFGALVCLLVPCTVVAQSDDLAFVKALRARGYFDFAAMQLKRMKTSKYLDESEKAEASLGLADLHKDMAARETDPAKKEAELAEATKEQEGFVKDHPDHKLVVDTQYDLAQLLMQRGSLVAEVLRRTDKAATKKKLLAKALGLFEEARKVALSAAEGYAKIAGSEKVEVKRSRSRSKRHRRHKMSAKDIARVRMLDAKLLVPQLKYAAADLYKVGSKEFTAALQVAIKGYQDFAKKYPHLNRTLQADLGRGLCLVKLKKYEDARKAYRSVIRTRPIAETDAIRQLAYYRQAQVLNLMKRYSEAIKAVSVMLGTEWPDLLDKDKAPVALAAKLEEGKALIALAKQSRAHAEKLHKQKKHKDADAEDKKAEARINNAIKSAKIAEAAGGVWGRQATELIAQWAKLRKKAAPKRTATEAFAEADGLYKANKCKEAIPIYREAIIGATSKQKQLVIQSWLKMAACYYKIKRIFEAAVCFDYVPRYFGASAVKPEVAYISLCFFSQLYQQQKTPYAARRYLGALQFFGRNYPKSDKAPETQFMAAEIGRDRGKFGEAAKDYSLVPPANERYEQSAYLAGLCGWLEFLKLYDVDKEKAMPYAKLAEKALSSFIKWSVELPKIEPSRVGKGTEWIAKGRVDLGEIYVHPAINRPAKAIELLAGFVKRYPKYQASLIKKVYYIRVRAYALLEEPEKAEKEFLALEKADPKFPSLSMASRLVGRTYYGRWKASQGGDPDVVKTLVEKTAKYLAKIVVIDPNQPLGDYVWIGSSLYEIKKYKIAADVLKKGVDLYRPKVGQQGVTQDAINEVELQQAECYLALKDYVAALELIHKAVEREPKVIDYRKDYATCCEKSGRFEDALAAWRKVAAMSPDPQGARFRSRDILDWPALCKTLATAAKTDKPSPAQQILKFDAMGIRQTVEALAEGKEPDADGKSNIVEGFNYILTQAGFYDAKAFAGVKLPDEAQALIKQDPKKLDERALERLNRVLLEAAFPKAILTTEARDYNWHLGKAKVALMHLELGDAKAAYDMLALTREFYPDWGAESSPKIPKLYQAVRDKLPDEFKKKLAALEKAEEQPKPEAAAPAAKQ